MTPVFKIQHILSGFAGPVSAADAEQVVGEAGADQRGGAGRQRVGVRGGGAQPVLPQLHLVLVRIRLLSFCSLYNCARACGLEKRHLQQVLRKFGPDVVSQETTPAKKKKK